MTLTAAPVASVSEKEKTKSQRLFDAYDAFYKGTKNEFERGYSKFKNYLDTNHPDMGIETKFLQDNFEDLGNPEKRKEMTEKLEKKEPETAENKEELKKKLTEYTKEELGNESEATIDKIVTKDLAEKAVEDSKNTDKQVEMKLSKDDLLSKYKALLDEKNILVKQNDKLKEMVFDRSELIISPREYFRRVRLININKRIEKFKKTPDYPRSAMIYFVSMTKFRDGGRVGASIKRGLLKGNAGAFFTSAAGGLNVENLKKEMKTCMDKFAPDTKDTKKVKLMKELIFEEVKKANNTYLDNITAKNKI